jgi:hypothetical protein
LPSARAARLASGFLFDLSFIVSWQPAGVFQPAYFHCGPIVSWGDSMRQLVRLWLPHLLFVTGCAVFFFVYLMLMIFVVGRLRIIDSGIGSLIMWGALLIVYFIAGRWYIRWYVRRVLHDMYPKDRRNQVKAAWMGGWAFIFPALVCLAAWIWGNVHDRGDMSNGYVVFAAIGTVAFFFATVFYGVWVRAELIKQRWADR